MEKNKQNQNRKKTWIMGIILPILMIALISFVQAEMSLMQSVEISVINSEVQHRTYIYFDDTSAKGIGANKLIPVNVYYEVQPLPANLTRNNIFVGQVDWCNVSFHAIINNYNDDGMLTGTTEQSISYYFNGNPYSTGRELFMMANRDIIIATATCHYTNASELYIDNILFANLYVLAPSYECEGCGDSTLEGLSNKITEMEASFQQENSITDIIIGIVSLNFQVWAVLVWIIKILLILVSLGLLFYAGFWIYKFLKDLAQRIEGRYHG